SLLAQVNEPGALAVKHRQGELIGGRQRDVGKGAFMRPWGSYRVWLSTLLLSSGGCQRFPPPPRVIGPPAGATPLVTQVAPYPGGRVYAQPSTATAVAPASHVWPRIYNSASGDTMTLYQPQVDSWDDNREKIRFRAAFALTPAGSGRTDY